MEADGRFVWGRTATVCARWAGGVCTQSAWHRVFSRLTSLMPCLHFWNRGESKPILWFQVCCKFFRVNWDSKKYLFAGYVYCSLKASWKTPSDCTLIFNMETEWWWDYAFWLWSVVRLWLLLSFALCCIWYVFLQVPFPKGVIREG